MRSIFADEWRACLIEHYKMAVRTGNRAKREEARQTMQDAGFSEEELSQLYLESTMHVDDVPDDFVPDLVNLESERFLREQSHPLECVCPRCNPPL